MKLVVYLFLFWQSLLIHYFSNKPPVHDSEKPIYQFQVTYEMELNFDGYKKYYAELYIGPSKALFVYHLNQKSNEPQLFASDSLENTFHFDLLDTMRYSILSDQQNKRILHLERVPGQKNYCVVQEALDLVEWNFTGKSKEIQGFHCLEANGRFAGRQYTVWFTDSIPAFFGPWKLHGLPGLVLEAYDESREVNFYANLVGSRSIDDTLPYDPMAAGNYEVIDRVEFVLHLKEYIEKIRKRMMTKFPRGYQVTVQSSPIKSIEIYDR